MIYGDNSGKLFQVHYANGVSSIIQAKDEDTARKIARDSNQGCWGEPTKVEEFVL